MPPPNKEPTAAEVVIGAIAGNTEMQNYEGLRVRTDLPKLTASTFEGGELSYSAPAPSVPHLVTSRLQQSSSQLGNKWFLKSGAEMLVGNASYLPSEYAGMTGDEMWEAFDLETKQIFANNGVGEKSYSGLTAEQAAEKYRQQTEYIRLQDTLARARSEDPGAATASAFGAFGLNVATDPTNLLILTGAPVLSATGRSVAKMGIKALAKKEGLAAAVGLTGAKVSTATKVGLTMEAAGKAASTGDSVVGALLGLQDRTAMRVLLGASGASINTTLDFAAQVTEHETLEEWDLIAEEFNYSWMRGGISFGMGLALSQVFAGGRASYLRKGNAAVPLYGTNSLAHRRILHEVINEPRRATEVISVRQGINSEMIERATKQLFTPAERLQVPFLNDPDWFRKVEAAGYDFKEEELISFLLKVPSFDELQRHLKQFDPSRPSAEASLKAAVQDLEGAKLLLFKLQKEYTAAEKNLKDGAQSTHDVNLTKAKRAIDNQKRKIKRREAAVAAINKSRAAPDNPRSRAIIDAARKNHDKAKADLETARAQLKASGTQGTRHPLKSLNAESDRALAQMRAKVKAAEDTERVARRAIQQVGMEERAAVKASMEEDLSAARAELDRLIKAEADLVAAGPLSRPNAIQQKAMIDLTNKRSVIDKVTAAQQKATAKADTLRAKMAAEAVSPQPTVVQTTSFSRATKLLTALVRLRKAQASGKTVDPSLAAEVKEALDDLTPADWKRLGRMGLKKDSLDLNPEVVADVAKIALSDLQKFRKDLIDRGFKGEGSGATAFIKNIEEYYSAFEMVSPYGRTTQQKAQIIAGLLNKDVLRNIEFITTGDVEKYLRQTLIRHMGMLTDLGTRHAAFRKLENHLLNPNTPLEDIHAVGYVIDIFAHMGSPRQRKTAINPNEKWIGGAFHQHTRAVGRVSTVLEKYKEAIGLSAWTDSTSEAVHKVNKQALQVAAGVKTAAQVDPKAAAGGKVIREFFDDMGQAGIKNGAIASLLENYLTVEIHPSNMKFISERLPSLYHKKLSDDYLKLPNAELHVASVVQLDWAQYKRNESGHWELVITDKGRKALDVDPEEVVDIRTFSRDNLNATSLIEYGDMLSEADGALMNEARKAIERRMTNTDVIEKDFNEFGIYAEGDKDPVFMFKKDINRARKIEQDIWFSDEVLDSGVIQTNVQQYLLNQTGKVYKTFRQDFINDYYGRMDFDFASMVESMELVASKTSPEIRQALGIAIEQIKGIDARFSNGNRYLHEADLAEAAYGIRQWASAGINLHTAPLIIGVEGSGSVARALMDGNFFGFFHQIANYFALAPKEAKAATMAIGFASDELSRSSHIVAGANSDLIARSGSTWYDKLVGPLKTLRKNTNKKPDGSDYNLFSRVGAAANEASRILGLEEHLSKANRISTLQHEFWLFQKHASKIPAMVDRLRQVNPDNAKEFRAALREIGWGRNEAYARQILASGMGEDEVLAVLRQLPPEAFDDIGTLEASLMSLGIDKDRVFTDRLHAMWKQAADTWNPANNPLAAPSSESPVHSFFLMFTTHANNFFQTTMQNIGNRQNGEAAALIMTYTMMEYVSFIMRSLAFGQITPEDLRKKIDEDPIGVLADSWARSAVVGPWLGGLFGAPLDMLVDSEVMEGGFADAAPKAIGLEIFGGSLSNIDKAADALMKGRLNVDGAANAVPIVNKELKILADMVAQDNR